MANRHLSRSIVLQSLFEWDFNSRPDVEVGEIITRVTHEFAPGLDDTTFINDLAESVIRKKTVIDDIIEKAAPDWPLSKISIVDRNILRMGLAELLFGDRTQVPPKVAINEAIELAKTFGGENSSKFVNGVLGAVYKEIGEPGKDEVSKKKAKEDVDPATLPVERKAGAVVYAWHDEQLYFALVHDIFGYWTLSKGGVDEGDSDEDACMREIKDEIGVPVTIVEKLGENEYIASHPEKGRLRKHVVYFLVEAPYEELTLSKSGGLDDVKWFRATDIAELRMYDDIVPLFTQAIEILTKDK